MTRVHFAIVADAYPPMRTSGAVQVADLARELVLLGYRVTVLVPRPDQIEDWRLTSDEGVELCELRTQPTKDIGYARRTLNELRMPYTMRRKLRSSPVDIGGFDGVIWYSPSIFFTPLVATIKRRSGCRSYLILRDIFPRWALDMGLLTKGMAYRFLDAIAARQYRCADVIGVQAVGNLAFFPERRRAGPERVELLDNWLRAPVVNGCSIDIAATKLKGRKVFVYAGNMGVAQGMKTVVDLAARSQGDPDIGFLLVGRGSEIPMLQREIDERRLTNVLLHDEIPANEIAGLFAQAHAGLVLLDPRHVSQNIPGKFVAYMHSGLPVFACIDPASDLATLIQSEAVGSCATPGAHDMVDRARALMQAATTDETMRQRCRILAQQRFSAHAAARQVAGALLEAGPVIDTN